MKKILSLMTLLLLTVATAWAATVDELVAVGPGYTFIAENVTSKGTVALVKDNLYDSNRIFTPTGNTVATNKQSSTFAGGTYLNCLRLKKTQDQLVFKVSEPCIVTFYTQSHASRGINVGSTVGGTEYGQQDVSTTTFECVIPAAGLVYLSSFDGDFYFAGFEVTASSKTVYFDNSKSNWETVNIWAWDDDYNNYTGGVWPGVELTQIETGERAGQYSWTTTGNPTHLLFNNGSDQTADLDFVDGSTYTIDGRVVVLNDYTVTFKTDAGWSKAYAFTWTGETKELGEWPGTEMTPANEDGTWTITVKAENAPANIIFHNNEGVQTPDWTFEADKAYEYMMNDYTATFTTDAGWENVYAYAWNGTGDAAKPILGDYPGKPLEATDGVYTLNFKAFKAESILFNNGTDLKTPDMTFIDGRAYKWITSVTPVYALAASSEKIPAGTSVGVLDNEEVVATLTYGVEGDADFNNPVAYQNEDYAGFTAYTTGNGKDGSDTGGTVYYIEPVYDGIITVGVCLNANKNFYILEDETALADFNGITLPYKAYTAFTFPVKGGSKYSIYCSGSKLGFFGFDYEFPEVKFKVGGSMNDWSMVNVRADSYTFNLEAGTYQFKVLDGDAWKGFDDLTAVADYLYFDGSGNVCFRLAEAGDVTVNYKSGELFTVAGNFAAPSVSLAGSMNEWSATANVLTDNGATASATINLAAGDYEFKMVVEGTWLTRQGDGGKSYELHRGWRTVDGVNEIVNEGGNMTLQADAAGEYTFTWEYATNTLIVTYPTGDLTLSDENDNTDALTEWDGTSANITLNRTLVGNTWNTLAAPFSISVIDFAALKTILGYSNSSISLKELTGASFDGTDVTLTFDDADEIQAGHPYLVKVSKDINLATLPAAIDVAIAQYSLSISNPFKNVVISKDIVPFETNYIDFIPTLGKTTITGVDADDVLFLAAENTLKHPAEIPADMKGFRAYFQLKAAAEGARAFNLDLGEGETTGISTVSKNNVMMNNDVYDLQGRKVQNAAQKGIYIMNGRKVVNK